jgi:selenocysteine lyase/cysteine desulfurase
VVALSSVQFTSGFAVSIESLAEICRDHGIDLVLDAAQSSAPCRCGPRSTTSLPSPQPDGKLLGPIGSGLMYTSPELRDKLSTSPSARDDDAGLRLPQPRVGTAQERQTLRVRNGLPCPRRRSRSVDRRIHLRYGVEAIRAEILRLQDLLISALDPALFIVPHAPR